MDPVSCLDSDSLYHLATWFDFKDLNRMRGVCVGWKQFVDQGCNHTWFRLDYQRRKLRISSGKKVHVKSEYDPRTCYFRRITRINTRSNHTGLTAYGRETTCSNPDHLVNMGREIVLMPRYIATVDYRRKFMRDLYHRTGRDLTAMKRGLAECETKMQRTYAEYYHRVNEFNRRARKYNLEKHMYDTYGVLSNFSSADVQAMCLS